ncbi:MAG TPA: phage holin family protein [Steroidobacteraceae bacterium]
MASITRPVSKVLNDILDNLQDIVKLEAKLATAELRADFFGSKKIIVWRGVAALSGFFACVFLMACGFFALRYAVPDWAAAAILTIGSGAICALGVLMSQKDRARRRREP